MRQCRYGVYLAYSRTRLGFGDSMSVLGISRWAAGLLVLALTACGDSQQKAAPPAPPTVTVAHPVKRSVVDYDEYVGRFLAVDMVEVRARVSGYLEKVHFQDGQIVKQGDLLFTIDRRPFQNALDQARANLTQAQSNLTYAQADLARGQQLVRDKTITEQTFQQRSQAMRNAEAVVTAAQAAVRQAELDVEFTELRAPIAGRIGDRRVAPGNLVTGGTGGNTTLLATIVSTDPIRLEFSFDEASFLRYSRLAGAMQGTSRGMSAPVAAKLLDEAAFSRDGRMYFVDNVIDRSSGTIRGRAQFANPDSILTPGMFARVRIAATAPYEALLVPDAAIGSEQARKYVLVVGPDDVVATKYVTLGQVVDDLRVIKSGVEANDRVVVNGLARAKAGQKVTPQEQDATPPAPQAKVN
jgi:RND family efflux transporter MFP subunit